jgi:uncharacterized protein (DUF849 family)
MDTKNKGRPFMPLSMNRDVFITCAVTGSGGSQPAVPHVPRSPKQIADSAIDAAKAGAAIVHCHVRDPETGKPEPPMCLYKEVTERIRAADVDVVLNLTAGMGGDMVFGNRRKARCRSTKTAPTWAAPPTAWNMCANACRKSARSIAAR